MNLIEGELMTEMHLDSLSFGTREINEMMSLITRYDSCDKVFVLSLQDNGLDEDCVSLILQLLFTLPYLRSLDLRRNCFGPDACKRIEESLKQMEGVTAVIKTAGQILNVHSGNQLRLSVDISEQMPKDQVAKEIDFSVKHELQHSDADPFLASSSGETGHPWAKSGPATQMRSGQQAVPDPSAVELGKPSAGPSAPVVGGPPVGLGGPGNVAALNKKAGKAAKAAPGGADAKRRQSRRAKGMPPDPLDYVPDGRVVDGGYRTAGSVQLPRPSSSSRLRSAVDQLSSMAKSMDRLPVQQPQAARQQSVERSSYSSGTPTRLAAIDRSSSMPVLKPPARQARRRM